MTNITATLWLLLAAAERSKLEPSAVTAVDPAEGQIDCVRRKPVAARSSVRAALLRLRRAHRGKRFFQCVNLRLHGGELRT